MVPRATDVSAVDPGVSTSATTSGALTSSIAYTLPWTLAPNGPSGPNGSVVRVEKPVVSVQTMMIGLVRTLPHPELQTSMGNYVGCGLVDHTESRLSVLHSVALRPGVSD
ncbi:hypothetical protein Dimus_006530 [Dionaea muscipula]